MDAFKQYLIQNCGLVLILLAFTIILQITVFLDKKTLRRMYILIAAVFALSIIVFIEFYLEGLGGYREARIVMMAIRYSAVPFIAGLIIYALVRNLPRWVRLLVFAPATILLILDIISIFVPIVFGIDKDTGNFIRGPLGYLPFIIPGLYLATLIFLLARQAHKRAVEIIPIVFLALSFTLGVTLPFFLGKEFSALFCTIIAISLFVYFVFSILDLSKRDPLTGLLNRQAYYADVTRGRKGIVALISLDMNGLKALNDTYGHAAGDEALQALAECFNNAVARKQAVYRIGGDEFIIVCRKISEEEVKNLIETIASNVEGHTYGCAIGYAYDQAGDKEISAMVKEADAMMYGEKAKHYAKHNRRH